MGNRDGSDSEGDNSGRRLSDDLTMALKEVHDGRSAFWEIEALSVLQGSQNVVIMHNFFWCNEDDEDTMIVLEFLKTDLPTVIAEGGLGGGEVKRWMMGCSSWRILDRYI